MLSLNERRVVACWIAAICVGLLAWEVSTIVRDVKRDQESLGWPKAAGIIRSSEVVETFDHDGTEYYFSVSYSYQVAGRQFTSDRIVLGMDPPPSWSEAAKRVSWYPVGQQVAIAYDPKDPGEAVLEPGVGTKIARFDAYLFAAMLAFWPALFGLLWMNERMPPWLHC